MPRNLQNAAHTLDVSAQDIDGALIFKNSTSLRYLEKGFSIFIQSDKAIYKPGQKGILSNLSRSYAGLSTRFLSVFFRGGVQSAWQCRTYYYVS